MNKLIYADNAATTQMSKVALDAMIPYFNVHYGNPSSLYSFGQESKTALDECREKIGKVLNAEAKEIFFTSGGTESDNWAIHGVAEKFASKGKHIITSTIEHHAILHTLKDMEKKGFRVTYLPVDKNGFVSPSELEKAICDDTILISIMAANNEVGTIEPIEEIGQIAKAHKVLFHVDAVQAVGHIEVDVKKWNCDLLSLSGHKFNGPRGIGVLYIKKGLRLPIYHHGGAQEGGRRGGTENLPAIVGMAKALEINVANMENETSHIVALRNKLFEGLGSLPYTTITGDLEKRLPSIASFVFEGVEGESLLLMLDLKGICVSTGSACSSASLDPSHVLLSMGYPHAVAHGSLRLSLSADNTEEEIEYIIKSVKETVEFLRNCSPVWDKKAQKPTWDLSIQYEDDHDHEVGQEDDDQ